MKLPNIPNSENGYAGVNFSGYSDSKIDSICAMSQENMFRAEREKNQDTIKQILMHDKPILFLYSFKEMLVTREDFCSDSVRNEVDLRFLEEYDFGNKCSLSP